MALGFFRNRGQPRSRIVALEHGYHGDTIGCMSVGARGVFNAPYEPLLFEVERIPFPVPDAEQPTLDAFEALCRRDPPAALILEPLILGAGGMLIYSTRVGLARIETHLRGIRRFVHRRRGDDRLWTDAAGICWVPGNWLCSRIRSQGTAIVRVGHEQEQAAKLGAELAGGTSPTGGHRRPGRFQDGGGRAALHRPVAAGEQNLLP